MRRAILLASLLCAHGAWAKGDKRDKADKADKDTSDDDDEAASSDDSGSDDEESTDDEEKPKKKKKAKAEEEEAPEPEKPEIQKQDLTGHDLGTSKKTTAFEKDRFFVDKVDTEKTENGTLVQGSITSTTFAYSESGGNYPGANQGPDYSSFSRMFTDLRLQTDFRHIKGSRWEARIDTRLRFVNSQVASTMGFTPIDATHIQSGLTGQNEYEIRELWLIRNGVQTDVILGRQFIPDLAAVKIDGLRIDYASSPTFTLLGFGGLYPFRGSRSITTDYPALQTRDTMGNLVSAGQFVGATGFGAAYRTLAAYGSFGGVALVPFEKEQARIFGTANGYWRYGSKVDFYHFVVLDIVGTSTVNAGLTNLSGGMNYKPNPRLRMTASYNRVDTDTLNVQANAYLGAPQTTSVIQNEVYVSRLATTQYRGSISAGLGDLERFEVTAAMAYRTRPSLSLSDGTNSVSLPGASGVEVFLSLTDRRSIGGARLGADVVRTFGTGTVAYQRTEVLAVRGFGSHEIKDGRGEIEAEVSYASTKDIAQGGACLGGAAGEDLGNLASCFGTTTGAILSLGGSLYYRFNSNWFMLGSLYLSRTDLTQTTAMMTPGMADPTITGLSGFFRLAYRF